MSINQPYNEHELLLRIAEGDEAAFRILFDHYWDRIYINILHICKQPEMAEDLSQEVFIRIWLRRDKLREIERFESFLYQVSKNLVLDEFRKKVLPNLGDDFFSVYLSDHSMDISLQLEQKELRSTLRNAVEQLPPQMQRVFTLHRFEGLTHQQIAQQLNISRVSSQTYMARAIIQLRKILAKHKGDLVLLGLFLLDQ